MTLHVALLRGVNVGGHRMVAMSDLRDLLARLGLTEPRTLLQSGNLVFGSSGRSTAQLERLLEAEAAARLGLKTDFVVRTSREWQAAIAGNPFSEHAKRDPARLLLMFLKKAPQAAAVKTLQHAITGPELLRVSGNVAYLVYPTGIGTSRLTGAAIEKTLGTQGTARNWNTVQKLAAAAGLVQGAAS